MGKHEATPVAIGLSGRVIAKAMDQVRRSGFRKFHLHAVTADTPVDVHGDYLETDYVDCLTVDALGHRLYDTRNPYSVWQKFTDVRVQGNTITLIEKRSS